MSKPLISFLVATYNQENYIAEAVKGAFAQTYSPLEIIVSDDNSRDRTFEIVQEMAAGYRGPHKIILNKNATNLGIGGHVNRIMDLTQGELVVAGAGDDISVPERTQVLFDAWEKSGGRATSVFSSYQAMSEKGELREVGGLRAPLEDKTQVRTLKGSLLDFLTTKTPVVNGCTHMWSRELFRYFGPLKADLEDLTLSFRTLAIGELVYVHPPLVKYRRHEANVSFFAGGDDTLSFDHREKRLRWVDEKSVMAYDCMLGDIATLAAKGRIPADEAERLTREAARIRSYYAIERDMMDGTFVTRLGILGKAVGRGNFRGAARSLPRGLPRGLYRRLYLLRDQWRAAKRAKA